METDLIRVKQLAIEYYGEDYAMHYLWGVAQRYIPSTLLEDSIRTLTRGLELRAEKEVNS